MENKISFPNHESMPSYSRSNVNKRVKTSLSVITHPAVRSRDKDYLDTILQKINSGDNIFNRIPNRLDPDVQFSDDEEEEEKSPEKKSSEDCFTAEKDFVKNSHFLSVPNEMHNYSKISNSKSYEYGKFACKKSENQLLSASKFAASRNHVSDIRCQMPQSESRAPKQLREFSNPYASPKLNTLLTPVNSCEASSIPKGTISNSIAMIKANSLPNEQIQINGKLYSLLSLLGSGGSCKVYSAYDLEKRLLVAVKRVVLSKDTDASIQEGYKKEIEYLQKLQGSNRVIKMYDFEYRENELLLILEHGDIDFGKYISNEAKLKRLSPIMIKFYWAQMLEAVADIHKHGIVHSDLKPSNFLLVAGNLKLIDFGIATSVPDDKTSTFRDTQVGTLNYMSPEAITQLSTSDGKQLCFKVGVKSDVWSLGCILYNLVYGITPFQNIKYLMQKIHAITNPNHEIPFKPLPDNLLIDVLKSCLKRNPKERASVEELLKHPYLTDYNASLVSVASAKSTQELRSVLEQMQILTPNRMRYVTKVVKELSEKSNS